MLMMTAEIYRFRNIFRHILISSGLSDKDNHHLVDYFYGSTWPKFEIQPLFTISVLVPE
jgi:hypothetical protein